MGLLILRSSVAQEQDEEPLTALAEACEALASDASASFETQSALNENHIAWETAWFHDAINGRVHLMGKAQNADSSWAHIYYDEATDAFVTVGTELWENPGHIYGNFTIDAETGDLYCARGGMDNNSWDNYRRLRWWKHSEQDWDSLAPVSANIRDAGSGLDSHCNGVAYHPNLYGSGVGGLVVHQQSITMFWRKSNDVVEETTHSDLYGSKEGAAVYWPSEDCVICGGSDGEQHVRIDPNGGNKPTMTNLGNPPIPTAGHSHLGSAVGSLHVHPGDPTKLVILELNGARVWTSSDGDSWSQVDDHPFTDEPRVHCSLEGEYGCFWAIGVSSSVLWRMPV